MMELVTPNVGNFLIVVLVVSVIYLILLISTLIDILKHDFKGNDKVAWIIVVLFLPFLGSMMYLLIGRKNLKR